MASLTRKQVMTVVNRYIGVAGGYLGDFSYRTHADFYAEYCDLDCNPYDLDGTTRERFIQILSTVPPRDQAAILRGVTERFPVDSVNPPATRTEDLRTEILGWADLLDLTSPVAVPTIRTTTEALERALADAEALLNHSGAPAAVDRIHTALHAYLEFLSEEAGIAIPEDAPLTKLFKLLRNQHPALQGHGSRSSDITKILNSSAAILDALNPVRNQASGAHPNPVLLEPPEAMLVINVTRSLLHYLNASLSSTGR